MKFQWIIEERDADAVRKFIGEHENKAFVRDRIAYNVTVPAPPFSREGFWKALIMCLLTTQQRSGPQSPVMRLLCADPLELGLERCSADGTAPRFLQILRSAGGIRRDETISNQLATNLRILNDGGWTLVEQGAQPLLAQRAREPREGDAKAERDAAALVDAGLEGIGPKQARNLWQHVGMTRYEIPLDSRILKWLKSVNFPIAVSANALVSADYYDFILDGVQELCKHSDVLPCVLDAAIFASFDPEWNEQLLASMR
jgi:hypothetical protein